jgi:hypothetical protein
MDKIGNAVTASLRQAHSLTPSSRSESERLRRERELNQALTKALVTCADFGKASPLHMSALVAYLDTLDPTMVDRLLSVTEGIQTRCKFMPTIADFAELKREFDSRYQPLPEAPTWMRFKGEDVDVAPVERRKAQVLREMGYDPQRKGQTAPRGPLVPPTTADLEEVRSKAKMPDAPISDALKAHLRDSGYAETLRALGKPVPVWMQQDPRRQTGRPRKARRGQRA